jgi:phage tail-like protein
VNAIPSYRQYLLLGPGPGWRVTTVGLTEDTATGAYSLDALPGAAVPWPPIQGEAPGSPAAIALGKDGRILVLDGADMRIKVVDPAGARPAHRLRGVGGFGLDPRRFAGAEGLAVLQDGAVAVADTGNRAVKVFSPYPHALLAVWTGFGRPARIVAGADGLLWVLERDGHRVIGVDRDGQVRVVLSGVTAPIAIAVDTAGNVAVLDGTNLLLFPPTGGAPTTIGTIQGGTCLAFGTEGILHAGSTAGLVYGFARDGKGGWQSAGIGVVGQGATVDALMWLSGTIVVAVARVAGTQSAGLWQIDATAGHLRTGTLTSNELDSGISQCEWHRIALDADVPAGSAIEVQPEVYDTKGGHGIPDLIPPPLTLSGDTLDCLVQGSTGRYLRLHLTFKGNGVLTPVLRGIKIWYPRDSLLKYLPAIYQEDAESRSFLARFLSILQTDFDNFDETIDNIWTYFDPAAVPANWFLWLAAWIALPIEPTWTDTQRRAVLKNAGQQYRQRGTAAGLQQLISDYAGVSARLFENFRLRQLIFLQDDPTKATPTGGGRLWSRDYYRRLQIGVYSSLGYFELVGEPQPGAEAISWGAHQFTIFFNAEPLTMAATQKKVAAVVEREKPAHTMAAYRPVYSRLRVGVQATIGLDTRVGVLGEAVLGRMSTLNYDSILAPSPVERGIKDFGASIRPRLGITTRLC